MAHDLTACVATLTTEPFTTTPAAAEALFAAAAGAGFRGVSLMGFLHSGLTDRTDPGRTDRALADLGLRTTMVEACLRWVRGAEGAEADVALLDLAVRAGAPLVGTVVLEPELPAGRAAAVAGLRRLADLAADRGLALAVEFLPWSALPDLRTAWALVAEADRPDVGITLDTWHWFRRPGGVDPTQLDEVPAGRILVLQLEDVADRPEADPSEEAMHRRRLPGAGAADLVGLLRALRAHGADPVVMPEVFDDALAATGPAAAAAAMFRTTSGVLDAAGW
jgi:sugar phosphate isomerase/epimerase